MSEITFINPFALVRNTAKTSDLDKLSVMILEQENPLSKLLFYFVGLEFPAAEQTIYSIVKLNNSIRLALETDNYGFIEDLFIGSSFVSIRDAYSEFCFLDFDKKIELLSSVSEKLEALGYHNEGVEYFVTPV